MTRHKVHAVLAVTLAAVVALGTSWPAAATDATWTQVGAGSVNNISGMAAAPNGWIVVHDNKQATQPRIALVDDNGDETTLGWPGTPPTDLESIDQVPGSSSSYATLTSKGQGTLLDIEGTTVTRTGSFALPNAKSNVESFALTLVGGSMVAVWATRGSNTTPAKVSAATFSPSTGVFGKVSKGKVTVPYPTTNLRQASDLKVVNGRLVIASTSDPGNNGPFTSALYDVGTITVTKGKAVLQLTSPSSLGRFDGHKIEGIACSGTTGMLGADDEKGGGWIAPFDFCG